MNNNGWVKDFLEFFSPLCNSIAIFSMEAVLQRMSMCFYCDFFKIQSEIELSVGWQENVSMYFADIVWAVLRNPQEKAGGVSLIVV